MNPNATPPRVIIRHCDEYRYERIRTILREGLQELGLKPKGRTLVKPNLVAAGEMFPYAHTRAEFVEGMILALQDVGEDSMSELAVGERCGITIPTRYVFKHSGVDAVLAKHPSVKRYCFEEEPQVEIRYTHEKRLRDYVFVPQPVAKADFFVNTPKFKAHPWTMVTFSMKNYIGIQDDRHRLIDHDHRLNEKVADLQYVIQPQFIAIDGIIAGEGRMLTPKPFTLNLIVMGNNQVAFDTVCSAIIGVDARDVDHIRFAHERGFGPIDLSKIEITGDVTLEDARKRARGFEVGLVRVEKYFEGTRINLRRVRGAHRREARREGRLHRRLRPVGGQDRRQRQAGEDREPLPGPLDQGPVRRRGRRHLREAEERDAEGARRAQGSGRAPAGLPGECRGAAAHARIARRDQEPVPRPRGGDALQ